jgi:hypothetical protein
MTPDVLIEMLLYYQVIDLRSGEKTHTDEQLKIPEGMYEYRNLAIYVMVHYDKNKYWIRNERFDDVNRYYNQLIGNNKQPGHIPFVDTHAKLWEDTIQKTNSHSLKEIYVKIYPNHLLIAQLRHTGNEIFKDHTLYVEGTHPMKTSYQLGVKWRQLLDTPITEEDIHQNTKLRNDVNNYKPDPYVTGDRRILLYCQTPAPQTMTKIKPKKNPPHSNTSPQGKEEFDWDKHFTTDIMQKDGLISYTTNIEKNYDNAVKNIMKKEWKYTKACIYRFENSKNSYYMTPDLLIEMLLYYQVIDLRSGEKTHKDKKCDFPPWVTGVRGEYFVSFNKAYYIMLHYDTCKYWIRNERFNDVNQYYSKLIGNKEKPGIIPFLDTHATLWKDTFKLYKTRDLNTIYFNIYYKHDYVCKLSHTGHSDFSRHKLFVGDTSQTSYELGVQWKELLITPLTQEEYEISKRYDYSKDEESVDLRKKRTGDNRFGLYIESIKQGNYGITTKPSTQSRTSRVEATQSSENHKHLISPQPGGPITHKVEDNKPKDKFTGDPIRRVDWVKHISGYDTEQELFGKFKGNYLICENGSQLQGGQAHYESIQDLLYRVSSSIDTSQPLLQIRIHSGDNLGNIWEIMTDPKHQGHVFQAASQFNGLECPVDFIRADYNKFLLNYANDKTQGPFCSIMAPVDAIGRLHNLPKNEYNKRKSQTEDNKALGDLNYLEGLSDYFNVDNGYVKYDINDIDNVPKELDPNTFPQRGEEYKQQFEDKRTKLPGGKLQLLPPEDTTEYTDLLGLVRVLYNENAMVYYGAPNNEQIQLLSTSFPVHQVFVAAANMFQGTSGQYNKTHENGNEKAYFLLQAAYASTYLAAHALKAKDLWLTLVGGGAFGNSISDIIKAINWAHSKYGHGLNVRLVDYVSIISHEVNGELVSGNSGRQPYENQIAPALEEDQKTIKLK